VIVSLLVVHLVVWAGLSCSNVLGLAAPGLLVASNVSLVVFSPVVDLYDQDLLGQGRRGSKGSQRIV
jgi:hypothetical protein